MIARPALPAALAALLDCRPGEETPAQWLAMPGCVLAFGAIGGAGRQRDGARFVVPRSPNARILDPIGMGRDVRRAWTTRDPAEAWEILDARGLLPPEGVRGFRVEMPVRASFGDGPEGDAVVYTMHARPVTIPDLVAWASLGADAIVTAEALAVESCRDLRGSGWDVAPCERVAWRVGQRPREPRTTVCQRPDLVLGVSGVSRRTGSGIVSRTIAPVRALWDAGLALERVGAECVLCVPPIRGAT